MRRSPLADGRATRHGPAARVHGAYFTIETGYPVTIFYYIKALRNRKCLKKHEITACIRRGRWVPPAHDAAYFL
jgi:hypothetical protein